MTKVPDRPDTQWIVNGSFPGNAWFYIVGQYLGALLATLIYVILKHLDYQEVVGDIETDNAEASATVANAPMTRALNMMPGVEVAQNSTDDDALSTHTTRTERDLEAGVPDSDAPREPAPLSEKPLQNQQERVPI